MVDLAALDTRRKRLAELVQARRRALHLSKNGARVAAEVSRGAWSNVEDGASAAETTYVRVEELLGWEPGSIIRYLKHDGPEPTLAAPEASVITDDNAKRDLLDTAAKFRTPEGRRVARAALDALWEQIEGQPTN
jgi:hypothetical protein